MSTTVTQFWRFGRKIVAIGRNYAAHAREMKAATPSKPFFFLKPTTSYIVPGDTIEVPAGCEVHHEVELGVVIGKRGRDIGVDSAMQFVGGYTVAIDLTARNLQAEAKEKGLPWTASKGYDTFCPVSGFIPLERIPDPHNVQLYLTVDGVTKQKGSTSDMIFKIPQLIHHVSKVMTLEEGDMICTGTPEGVGPILPGQTVVIGIPGVAEAAFPVRARPEA